MRENKDFRDYYDILHKINEGFGYVYEAKIKNTNKKRAIKVIDKKQIINAFKNEYLRNPTPIEMKDYMDCFFKEIDYMKNAEGINKDNDNSVKFYEYFDTENEFAIVMELCDDNLLNYFSQKKDGVNKKELYKILKLLNNTFKIMDENKIIYGDLKLKNILLKYEKENYNVKLKLNYGNNLITHLRRFLSSTSNMHYCNSFSAPEILLKEKYDEKCDLWSLGVIIYILCFRAYPYTGVTEEAILDKIQKNGQNNFKKTGDTKLDDLISKLLIKDPKERISWKEYFAHPYFTSFRDYYEIGDKLGEGGYGIIYKAKIKETGELRAIKIYNKNKIKEDFKHEFLRSPTDEELKPYFDGFLNEVKNMKIIEGKNGENKNSVKLYEYYDTYDEFAIVMELCDDNLLNLFFHKKESFKPEEILDILNQLNNSFEIIAEKKIVHRALKLENILIKYENKEKTKYIVKLKLTDDSGLMNKYCGKSTLNRLKGNIRMMAPELLRGENYDEKSDLWSLGIIIYVLSFRKYPYNGENEFALLNQIQNLGQKILKKTGNDKLDNIIKRLLVIEKQKRLSWYQYFSFSKEQDFRKYYENLKAIGEGGYGIVYRATRKDNNEKRAIKVFNKDKIRKDFLSSILDKKNSEKLKKYFDDLFNEVENMRIAEGENNENINTVKFYEYFDNEKEFAIVMELCDENLTQYIVNNKIASQIEEIKEILNQLNNTFKIMDDNLLAHRDIKLENILVKHEENGKNIFKIADYGISKKLLSMSKKFTSSGGTPNFMAPEVLEGENYNLECDLWSLGVVIYVLYFNKYPYDASTELGIYNKIKNFGQKILNKSEDKNLDNLIRQLLTADPKKRITWKKYFKHPFFNSTSVNNNKIIIKVKVEQKDKKNKNGNEFKDIYFLGNDIPEDKITNEFNDTNCELYINNEPRNFSNFFKPTEEGEYEITIIFNKVIENCSCMFNKCYNITSIDLSLFDSSNVIDMSHMFSECYNLKELNLNNLNTINVKYMNHMFNKCSELDTIILPESFNTENVENMSFMFHLCQNICGLNFPSNFKTCNVTNMKGMFKKCYLLLQLDLSKFNTEKVTDMSYMFDQCNKLEEILINESLFLTNNVIYMNLMFNECKMLKNINLSSFNINKVKYMNSMFNSCNNLTTIDLSNSINNEEVNMSRMFKDCHNLKIINLSSFIISEKNKIDDMFDNLPNIEIIFVNNYYIDVYKNHFKEIKNKFSSL